MNTFQETPSHADAFLRLGVSAIPAYGVSRIADAVVPVSLWYGCGFSLIHFAYFHGSCTNSAVGEHHNLSMVAETHAFTRTFSCMTTYCAYPTRQVKIS